MIGVVLDAKNKLTGVFCAILCISLVLVDGPKSSAAAPEAFEVNPSNAVRVAPVVELDPTVDPNDPEVQQEVEELTDRVVNEIAEAAAEAEPTQSEPGVRAQVGAAGFSHSYNTSGNGTLPTATQQARIESAIASWDEALTTTSGPIVIEITWENMGTVNVLGSAGPSFLYNTPDGLITAAQWNTQFNTDVNTSIPEILVNLNSAANWYTGSGSPSFNQIDLESVVLHELGHGLGFLGTESPGNVSDPASTYDHHVDHSGTPYLETNNPSASLVSDDLHINVSDSYQYEIYAPTTWTPGSSLSHFHEDTHPSGSPGALMTPTITSGDVHRTLDAPVLGVMDQVGWNIDAPLSVPSAVSVNTSNDQTTVSWNTNFHTFSYVPDNYRVDVLNGSATIASRVVSASVNRTTFNGLPNGTWTFSVTPVDQLESFSVDGTSGSTSATVSRSLPSTVDYISFTGTGLTQTIDWPNASNNPDRYVVEISTNGQTWRQIGTPTSSILNHTFSEGTYQVRVRGRVSSGDGPPNTSTFVPVGTTFVRPAPLDHQIRRLYLSTFLREPDQAGFTNWRYERAGGRTLASIAQHFAGSAEFQATYGNLNNTQFVELLYRNVFNRSLAPVGRATWVGLLDAGGTRGEVLARLSDSNEFVGDTRTLKQTSHEGSVRRLYLGYFKRLPDAAGLSHWVNELNRGRSLESISDHFAGSDEFQATYGSLSNADFVELLYFNILSRQPDARGEQEWVGRLNSGARSRGSVMVGFSESRELIILTGTAR